MADRELFCKEAFERLLRSVDTGADLRWQRVPAGEDPPDFWLSFGSQVFPVEVTSTEPMHKSKLDNEAVRQETYEASHREILESAQRTAKAEGILSGTYLVSFDAPLAGGDQYNAIRADFKRSLIEHLRVMANQGAGADADVRLRGLPVAWIYKLNDRGEGIHATFESGAWTESPEFMNYVGAMLQRAVQVKASKLADIDHSHNAILLLLNTYPLAEPGLYRDLSKLLPNIQRFHSLCLVRVDGAARMIYSKNDSWSNATAPGAP